MSSLATRSFVAGVVRVWVLFFSFMSAAEVGNSPKTKFPTSILCRSSSFFLKIDLAEVRLKTNKKKKCLQLSWN